jgi:hypothetical protein
VRAAVFVVGEREGFLLECDEIEACLEETYGPEFEACVAGR